MSKNSITAEYLHSVLDYNPETGVFIWKFRSDVPKAWNTKYAGTTAGTKNAKRYGKRCLESMYGVICIKYRYYMPHNLAWLYMTGKWPLHGIDHRDLDVGNNKWNNLRECTKSQNQCNRKTQVNNTSGVKGVRWDKTRSKWVSTIKIEGRIIYLGRFTEFNQAVGVRLIAQNRYHGEFSRVA